MELDFPAILAKLMTMAKLMALWACATPECQIYIAGNSTDVLVLIRLLVREKELYSEQKGVLHNDGPFERVFDTIEAVHVYCETSAVFVE